MLKAGHDITLLRGGGEYFPALEAAIDGAARYILLEAYILNDDASAARIVAALARAADRGVSVRLVVDGFGTPEFPERFASELSASGVQWAVFAPVGSLWLKLLLMRTSTLKRLHRKLCVIDSELGFCGGINLLDDLQDPNHGVLDAPRFDFAVRLRGPVVADMEATMRRLWQRMELWRSLRARSVTSLLGAARIAKEIATRRTAQPPAHDSHVGLFVRDNTRNRRKIEQTYLAALRAAKTEVIIANAYFLPGQRFRRALAAASKRGVRITLLLQGRYEYFLQYHATHALYSTLLGQQMEIFEYKKSFLHAKVAVFDSRYATVGSSNLDPLSLTLAQEANVWIDDAAFAQELRLALLDNAQQGATRLNLADYAKRPLAQRLRDRLAYAMFRILSAFGTKNY